MTSLPFQRNTTPLGDNTLDIATDQSVQISALFNDGDDYPSHIYVDGNEFSAADDMLHGLFVVIGSRIMSLSSLATAAGAAYPAIRKETELQDRYEADMARELSCPRRMGRI